MRWKKFTESHYGGDAAARPTWTSDGDFGSHFVVPNACASGEGPLREHDFRVQARFAKIRRVRAQAETGPGKRWPRRPGGFLGRTIPAEAGEPDRCATTSDAAQLLP